MRVYTRFQGTDTRQIFGPTIIESIHRDILLNISTKMYFKYKTKQYLLIIALTETALIVINYVMLTFSVKTLSMAIYSIMGPNICQVSVDIF